MFVCSFVRRNIVTFLFHTLQCVWEPLAVYVLVAWPTFTLVAIALSLYGCIRASSGERYQRTTLDQRECTARALPHCTATDFEAGTEASGYQLRCSGQGGCCILPLCHCGALAHCAAVRYREVCDVKASSTPAAAPPIPWPTVMSSNGRRYPIGRGSVSVISLLVALPK